MALYKYFSKAPSTLPDPTGPLKSEIPSSSIQAANHMVQSVLEVRKNGVDGEKPKQKRSRGPYSIYTAEEKARIGRRAVEMGVTNTMRFFKKDFEDRPLKESTVRTWAKEYTKELALRRTTSSEMQVDELPTKKRGRPLLLGEVLDKQLQVYIKALRESGAVINTAIVIAAAEGIVKSCDSNLLKSNGGHIECNKHWALSFLERIGYVKRRANTKSKVSVAAFEEYKDQFIFDVRTIMEFDEIPKEMIVNWDHTGINYVPVSSWTMAEEGSKRVEIGGLTDKRQIILVVAGSMNGDILPFQVLYSGKTARCLPNINFPNDWDVTFTANHWANESTTERYIRRIMIPYLDKKRRDLHLNPDHPGLVIFDRFKGQCTEKIYSLLADNKIRLVIVPGNCTDRLQPLDVSVNKSIKEFLRRNFQQWYADNLCKQLTEQEVTSPSVDLRMSTMKPVGARWLISLYDYLSQRPDVIINGFKGAGILFD